MAKFYPAMAKGFHGSLGEKAVFKALSCLNDEYVVFYSYRWLGSPQQRRSEGETDFLILRPRDLSQLYDGIFYVFYDRNQYIMPGISRNGWIKMPSAGWFSIKTAAIHWR